ncbi:MAG TPA: chromate resistance protein ChrB domain-containing protein [Vicinamibacterales bacterium]|nr:chromate resistance protein ChrB domain-containing protein [Vicinamibacterales bacterium]
MRPQASPPASGPQAAEPRRPRPRAPQRWLLFVHQLPSHPSNLRVSTWRRLQQIGAIPLKQAVYVLPHTPAAREDFEWLRTEVKAAGGEASVFTADNLDDWSDDALIEEFRRARQEAYAALARDAEEALKRAGRRRRPRGQRSPAVRRLLEIFRERLSAIEAIDFFGSAGRDRVIALLEQLEGHMPTTRPEAAPSSRELASYQSRVWVTRPRPGVDRMATAWLIRRFIDPRARFAFAADRQAVPDHAVPFDMFGADFSHQGDGCTFETLCTVFGIRAPALSRIAAIVHDLDLKDGRFAAPEGATVGAVIEGLQLAHQDDEALLDYGITLFDSLYRSFERSARAAGPRAVVRPRRATRTKGRTRRRG